MSRKTTKKKKNFVHKRVKIDKSGVMVNTWILVRLWLTYHYQQNKCYPKDARLSDKLQLTAALCNEIWPQKQIWLLLLWASKFATANIESSFEMGKWTPLGVTFIMLAMVEECRVGCAKVYENLSRILYFYYKIFTFYFFCIYF